MNEEIKKRDFDNQEIKEIFLKEKLKLNEELIFFNTIAISDNIESKKDEAITRKIKKTKNRVSI